MWLILNIIIPYWFGGSYWLMNSMVINLRLIVLLIIVWCLPGALGNSTITFLTRWVGNFSVIFFSSLSFILFYFLYELVSIPVILLIYLYGRQPEKVRASLFALIYTSAFSLPFLYIIIELSGDWPINIYVRPISCIILLGPFLVKRPIFLLHHWLPKAHVEAPTAGRIVLAAILLKVGVYGLMKMLTIIKYSLHSVYFATLVGSAIRAFLASLSRETKVIIAYSSVTHINLVVYGLNIISICIIRGGYLISLSHGYISALLFYSIGELYRLNGSRILYYNIGLLRFHGILMCMLALILLGNIRVPPIISFFGEVLLIPNIIGYVYLLLVILLIYFVISFYYSIYLLMHLSKIGQNGVSSPLLIIELLFIGVVLLLNILPILL